MQRPTIDVTKLVDEQQVGRFTIQLVIVSFIIILTDGFDLLAASYSAPALIAAWHVPRTELGPMFSASPFGMILGSPLLGLLGDKFGRRRVVIFGTVLYGTFTLLCATATSIPELIVLRFITGIGLGGMLPNITALNAEFAPKRLRATLVVIMFMGVTAGAALPALVVAAHPSYVWQDLFIVGGVVPLALSVVLYFILPESIKYLSLKATKETQNRIGAIVRRVRPDLTLSPDTVFVTPEARQSGKVPMMELFKGGLLGITPLLWLLFVVNLTANYFLYSWMPILFRSEGFTSSQAALTTACYYVGGMIGGLTVSRFIDRRGLIPVAVFFVAGCFLVGCIGIPGAPHTAVAGFVLLSGFCVLGVQLGLDAAAGLIYPTRIRATGAGWAYGIGRIGGIIGPMLGAWLISMKLTTSQLFLAPAVPLSIGAIGCFVLVYLCRQRFGGDQLNDLALSEQTAPAAAPSGVVFGSERGRV
jgi:AAHS family 4-hydroxybenzoate transporter-like MFS transporter